jgi:heptosyltransferase III
MQNKHSIVLSRTDSIGDVVLTLPMAGLLKKKYPGCRILFLGRSYTKDVVSLSIHVDGFINYDEIEKADSSTQLGIFKDLKADMIIHVFPNKRIAWLAKNAGIKLRVGTTNRLYHWFTCNRLIPLSRKRSLLHEAQLNLKLVKFLKVEQPALNDIHYYYGFSKLPSLESQYISLPDPGKKNIILHPKSKGSAKEWGLENFQRLVSILPSSKYKIFISGTTADGEKMQSFLKENPGVTDLTGKLSLEQFIAFITHCDVLIAASTGPLHIAAALNKKAIGLFSPKRPIHPGRWQPLGRDAHFIVYDKDCEKCRNNKDCDCIKKISPEQIVDLLEK